MSDPSVLFVLIPEGSTGEVHSTLVYMDEPEGAPPAGVLCEVGRMIARFSMPIYGFVMRYAPMGPEQVLTAQLDGPMLSAMYENLNVWAKSKWGYLPHITKQAGQVLPTVGTMIRFDRLGLWYGEERWAWRIGTGEPCAT